MTSLLSQRWGANPQVDLNPSELLDGGVETPQSTGDRSSWTGELSRTGMGATVDRQGFKDVSIVRLHLPGARRIEWNLRMSLVAKGAQDDGAISHWVEYLGSSLAQRLDSLLYCFRPMKRCRALLLR